MATGTLAPEGCPRHRKVISALSVHGLTVARPGGVRLLQVHARRASPSRLGIPVWVAELAFPIAFGLIGCGSCAGLAEAGVRAVAPLGILAGVVDSRQSRAARRGPGLARNRPALIMGPCWACRFFALLRRRGCLPVPGPGRQPANAIIGSYDQLTLVGPPGPALFHAGRVPAGEGHASDACLRLFRRSSVDGRRHGVGHGGVVRLLHRLPPGAPASPSWRWADSCCPRSLADNTGVVLPRC